MDREWHKNIVDKIYTYGFTVIEMTRYLLPQTAFKMILKCESCLTKTVEKYIFLSWKTYIYKKLLIIKKGKSVHILQQRNDLYSYNKHIWHMSKCAIMIVHKIT